MQHHLHCGTREPLPHFRLGSLTPHHTRPPPSRERHSPNPDPGHTLKRFPDKLIPGAPRQQQKICVALFCSQLFADADDRRDPRFTSAADERPTRPTIHGLLSPFARGPSRHLFRHCTVHYASSTTHELRRLPRPAVAADSWEEGPSACFREGSHFRLDTR